MALTHKPTLTKPTEGRSIAVSGDVYRFLAVGEDTNGNYALWEAVVPPGPGSRYGRQTQIACGLKSLSRVGINPCKRVTDFPSP